MKKPFRHIATRFCALLVATFVSTIPNCAFAADRVQYDNTINLGHVDIALSTIGKDNLDLTKKDKPIIILPGETVADRVVIANKGENAWVRIHPTFDSVRSMTGLDESMLNIADKNWKKCGNYWYYTRPLKKGEHVAYINSISIPASWTEKVSDQQMTLSFEADAIQEDNFNPDFNSDDPWFGTPIEHFNERPAEDITKTDRSFIVLYRGGAEGFMQTDDDFFSNWGLLMPGDTETGNVALKNASQRGVTLYFSSETLDQYLASQVDLTIALDGKEIYSGKMDQAKLDNLQLIHLNPGDDGHQLTYSVHVPETLTNEYALSRSTTRWIFTAKLDPEPDKPTQKKTNDSGIIYWILGIAAGGVLIGVAIYTKKRRKENRD